MICSNCGKREAEYGFARCWHCIQAQRERAELDKRKQAVEKERAERKKPKETVDDIARKARSHGLSYGKYLEARARGMYLSEMDE